MSDGRTSRQLAVLAVGAGLSGAGAALWRERARADDLQERLDRLTDERDRIAGQAHERDRSLREARGLIGRLQRSRRAEREWNFELRSQLARMREEEPGPDDREGVLSLVLKASIQLAEAERGMLLSRKDDDGDGELDLVRAQGFSEDPAGSAVAQRFAREVLARDQIVREDRAAPAPGGSHSRADEEIDNLVAIPLYIRDRFHGVVICANREGGFADFDDDVLLALGDHAGAALHTERLHGEVRDARRAGVRMLSEALGARDPTQRSSSGEVAGYARAVASRLGLDPALQQAIVTASFLRDVGHLALPDAILAKPGPLTAEERAVIEMHPRIGFEILSAEPALHDAAYAVLYHHERYDGGGYPAGVTGGAIPVSARIIAAADAFSAMTADRPWRPGLLEHEARAELVGAAGTQLDPEIVQLLTEELARASPLSSEAKDGLAHALPLLTSLQVPPSFDGLAPATDPVTLLGGHRAFREAAAALARRGGAERPFGIVLIDVGDLESVNQRDGYAAGDRLLQDTARTLRRAAARSGAQGYRESGRRLALLAPGRGAQDVEQLVTELHAELVLGPNDGFAIAGAACGIEDDVEAVLAHAHRGLAAEGEAARQPEE